MDSIYEEAIQLKAKYDWHYNFTEKVESDTLFYSIKYDLADECKIIFVELTGNGSSKLIHVNLNTNKGVKTGEFINHTTFANIYFQVERMRLYSEADIEFNLTLFKK